jgi:hypothetical protein
MAHPAKTGTGMELTNSREAGAFFLARAIIIAILFFINPLLTPVYVELMRMGFYGGTVITVVSTSISLVSWLVTFVLFIGLRGGFAGVPRTVSADRNAVTSSGGEIGAYVIAALVAVAALYILNVFVMAGIYASVRQSGGSMAVIPVSLAVSAVAAVLAFVILIALRSAMSGATSPQGPIEL